MQKLKDLDIMNVEMNLKENEKKMIVSDYPTGILNLDIILVLSG